MPVDVSRYFCIRLAGLSFIVCSIYFLTAKSERIAVFSELASAAMPILSANSFFDFSPDHKRESILFSFDFGHDSGHDPGHDSGHDPGHSIMPVEERTPNPRNGTLVLQMVRTTPPFNSSNVGSLSPATRQSATKSEKPVPNRSIYLAKYNGSAIFGLFG